MHADIATIFEQSAYAIGNFGTAHIRTILLERKSQNDHLGALNKGAKVILCFNDDLSSFMGLALAKCAAQLKLLLVEVVLDFSIEDKRFCVRTMSTIFSDTGYLILLDIVINVTSDTLPPCRITISKRGQQLLVGEFRGLFKKQL
jgi:hypothetical protein